MNPTLYDILGVPRDASPEQIKAAWRESAERFDPGTGSSQFRLFNQAAEVLLDPAKRAEYDASLADEVPEAQGAPEAHESAFQPESQPEPQPEPEVVEPVPPVAAGTPEPVEATDSSASTDERRVPAWPLLALAGVAVVSVGVMLFMLFARQLPADDAAQLERDARTAQSIAERAAVQVLSYDYEQLDTDRDAAARFLTPTYRKQYVSTFNRLVKAAATQTKAKVNAEVKSSAIMGAPRDGRIEVLLFVDQTTLSTANNGAEQTALNRVRFEMVRSDGTWLVNEVQSY